MIKDSEKIIILAKFNDGEQDCVSLSKKDLSKLKRAIRTYMALQGWASNSTSLKKCNKAERILQGFVY